MVPVHQRLPESHELPCAHKECTTVDWASRLVIWRRIRVDSTDLLLTQLWKADAEDDDGRTNGSLVLLRRRHDGLRCMGRNAKSCFGSFAFQGYYGSETMKERIDASSTLVRRRFTFSFHLQTLQQDDAQESRKCWIPNFQEFCSLHHHWYGRSEHLLGALSQPLRYSAE